jgi:catecholate siderophore receptor
MRSTAHPTLTPLTFFVRVALASTLAGASSFALAQEAAPKQEEILPQVVVKGQSDAGAYAVKRTTAGTKTDTLLRDLPQSVTVITQGLMRDQAMQSMSDVVRYVPGIGMANGEGNRDSPVFRGSTSASGDFYIDGARDDVEYYRDLYNAERIEALTGPNAMIFGRGGSGGVINRVSKQASFSTVRAADLTIGSFQNKRLTVDVGQAISDTLAFRVVGLVENSGGFQRDFKLKRSGINPTLAIRAGRDTRVELGFEHFTDERTTDRGVPSLNGRPYDTKVDAFFGDPDPAGRPSQLTSDALSSTIEHELGNGVQLSNKTRYTDYDKLYQNYNAGAINTKTSQVPISAYNNHQWRKNLFNQTDLTFKINSGGVKHTVLVGMELGRQETDYLRMTGTFANKATSINVPLAAPDGALPTTYVLGGSSSDRDGSSKVSVAGVYIQDQLDLGQHWQLIGGVRYDSFKVDYTNNRFGGLLAIPAGPHYLSSKDNLVSPRVGLVFKPVHAGTIYANYSVASFPRAGDQLSSLSVVNQGLEPEKFINYEIGGKWEFNPDLLATVAVYRLNRTNVAVTNPATGIADQLVDGARTNGVEVGISGKITPSWSIQGGYAHQDASLLATASATALRGASVGMVPKNTVSIWNRYDFAPGFGAGVGVVYRDDMFTSTSNTVVLPGYTRVDAALFYTVSANAKVQVNVENVLDKKYYVNANGDNNITPGSPRAVKLGMHVKF